MKVVDPIVLVDATPGEVRATEARTRRSLRDKFAANAMAAFVQTPVPQDTAERAAFLLRLALISYEVADALLKARGGKTAARK